MSKEGIKLLMSDGCNNWAPSQLKDYTRTRNYDKKEETVIQAPHYYLEKIISLNKLGSKFKSKLCS